MAKLTAFAALFMALMIAGATAYTTSESCEMEVQHMQMRHCVEWMEKGYETASFLRSTVANREDHRNECCKEMRKVREECHCDMMKKMMMTMQPMMGMEKMQSMFSMCGVEMPMECSFI